MKKYSLQHFVAYGTGLILCFAAGLFVDSLFGSAHIPPFAQAIACAPAETAATCASSQSTAVIAWWTRLDTIFSLFTGAAAIFAFLAYQESKSARIAAEKQASIAGQSLQDERARARGTLILEACSVDVGSSSPKRDYLGGLISEDGNTHFVVNVFVKADGPSSLRDVHFGFDLYVSRFHEDRGASPLGEFFRTPDLERALLQSNEPPTKLAIGFCLQNHIDIAEYRSWEGKYQMDLRLHFYWKDQFDEWQGKSLGVNLGGIEPSATFIKFISPRQIWNPRFSGYV